MELGASSNYGLDCIHESSSQHSVGSATDCSDNDKSRHGPRGSSASPIGAVLGNLSKEDKRFWRQIDRLACSLIETALRYKGEPATLAEVPKDWTPDFIAQLEQEHETMFAVVCVFKGLDFPDGDTYLLLFHRKDQLFYILDGELRKTTARNAQELVKWIEVDSKQFVNKA
jgi:hypothetical protein